VAKGSQLKKGAMQLDFEQKLFDEGKRIIEAATSRGVMIRLLGALAIRSHCTDCKYIHEASRRTLSDLDMASYRSCRIDIDKLFRDFGYKSSALAAVPSLKRSVYFVDDKLHVDVFYDALEMCHDISFKDRLEADYPTIPLAELVLEKMQIVQINEKDVIDTVMLFSEHEVGEGDKETINAPRIASLCSTDWGLWKTCTTNLAKTADYAEAFRVLKEEDKRKSNARISLLLDTIGRQPKSVKWKMRAKIGERQKWYNTVEDRR
jgi:hypothetical protein